MKEFLIIILIALASRLTAETLPKGGAWLSGWIGAAIAVNLIYFLN